MDMEDIPSHELIERWRNGDQAAATELYRRYFERLLALVSRNLSSRFNAQVNAEDVLQSVFRSVFRRAQAGAFTFADDGQLWKLLVTVALNKVRNRVRYLQAEKRSSGPNPGLSGIEFDVRLVERLSGEPTPADAASFSDLLEMLLHRLEPDEREALGMRLEGCDQKEIAAKLDVTDRTVRRMWDRIRMKLMMLLEDENGEDEQPTA
jgi:RNA polymerase sigma-70 factor (ECF subfamily)